MAPPSSSSSSSSPPPSTLPSSRHFSRAWNSSLVELPVGAPADVCELEYCSALRQASSPSSGQQQLRGNGSLTARDVQVHLLSRHSVRVPLADIERQVLVELVGGTAYQIPVPRGHGRSLRGGTACAPPGAPAKDGTGTAGISPAAAAGAAAAAALTGRPDEPAKAAVIQKTTPLDLVQQTALLLIPELHGVRAKTLGGGNGGGADLLVSGAAPPLPATASPPPHHHRRCRGQNHRSHGGADPAASGGGGGAVKEGGGGGEGDAAASGDVRAAVEAALLLICEQAGVEYGVELTIGVMRDILHAFSEDHWDDATVEQMVRAAAGGGGALTAVPVLDADSFLRALTSDLSRYRGEWSASATTHLQDVNSNEHVSDVGLPPPPLETFGSLPSIDYTAETYSNYLWTVLSWFLFMVTFGSYMVDKFSAQWGHGVECDPSGFAPFLCRVLRSSLIWLEVFVKLMVIGFGFIFLISLGNADFTNHRCLGLGGTIISMAFIVVVSALAFQYEVDTFFFSTSKVEAEEAVYYVSFVTGILLLLVQLVRVLRMLFPGGWHSRLLDVLVPSSASLEKRTKRAAEYKVRRLLRRSLACHQQPSEDTALPSRTPVNYRRLNAVRMHGQTTLALNAFHEQSRERRTVGSLWWIADSFLKGNSLAWQEGLWISPRLLWANLSQWFVICSTLVIQSICVRWLQTLADPITEGLTRSDLLSCLSIGLCACIAAQAAIAINYIPSAIRQTFQFRGGVLGSLHNKDFHDYRSSQDSVDYLFGSAFWGAQLTGLIVWAAVALTMLLYVWDFTRKWAISALVQLISFALTITLKNVLLFLLRRDWYAAFYRTKPGAANIMTVVLESLFLGLSTGYIISRAVMLIGLSCLYVSRIDTPFLAEGVGFGMDKYPIAFRTDILLHEAHRHPYMERWAMLYLLKLRHGAKFGTRAGGAWRILFTLALMPWLRKYRVYPAVDELSRARDGCTDSGVIPTSRINIDIQLAQQQAMQLELEDLRSERVRRIELELENSNLRVLLERLRSSSTAAVDHQSVYSC